MARVLLRLGQRADAQARLQAALASEPSLEAARLTVALAGVAGAARQ
jgi:hypothetical protein